MVSRRKILSRSRDDLNLDQAYLQQQQEDEEDVWYQKDKLFKVSRDAHWIPEVNHGSLINQRDRREDYSWRIIFPLPPVRCYDDLWHADMCCMHVIGVK